jgi:hypothetical protein
MAIDQEAMRRAGIHARAESDVERRYREEGEANRAARGRQHGLSAEQVQAADLTGMPLGRYAHMSGLRNLDDYAAAKDAVAAEAEVQREAQRQLAVERTKKDLPAA